VTSWSLFKIATACGYGAALFLIPRILMQRRESAATLSWIFALLMLPWLGLAAYWLIGQRRLKRYVRRKRIADKVIANSLSATRDRRVRLADERIETVDRDLVRVVSRVAGAPPVPGNQVRVFPDPDGAAGAMLHAIDEASESIHFEVYIFKDDEAGTMFRDRLVAAARRGVQVRLLVDSVGSFLTRYKFLQPIVDAGGEVATFLSVGKLSGAFNVNLRNHRKVTVIDGRIAYTGGLNVGNEYGGPRRRVVGPWRDTHMEVRGPSVARLQDVFAEDWHFATGKEVDERRSFPALEIAGSELVHVLPSGPDSDWEAIHHAIFAAITRATEHVFVTTPYFVPDRAMLVALAVAALRGVDVRLLVPYRSDHPLVLAAGRYHYVDLLRAGVRIFEYQGGMLHAKTVEVDKRWATVGSANLDLRSFRLNFELNLVAYGKDVATELHQTFLRDLERAGEVSLPAVHQWSTAKRFAHSVARLLEGIL